MCDYLMTKTWIKGVYTKASMSCDPVSFLLKKFCNLKCNQIWETLKGWCLSVLNIYSKYIYFTSADKMCVLHLYIMCFDHSVLLYTTQNTGRYIILGLLGWSFIRTTPWSPTWHQHQPRSALRDREDFKVCQTWRCPPFPPQPVLSLLHTLTDL